MRSFAAAKRHTSSVISVRRQQAPLTAKPVHGLALNVAGGSSTAQNPSHALKTLPPRIHFAPFTHGTVHSRICPTHTHSCRNNGAGRGEGRARWRGAKPHWLSCAPRRTRSWRAPLRPVGRPPRGGAQGGRRGGACHACLPPTATSYQQRRQRLRAGTSAHCWRCRYSKSVTSLVMALALRSKRSMQRLHSCLTLAGGRRSCLALLVLVGSWRGAFCSARAYRTGTGTG